MINLSVRLSAIADFARSGKRIIDVGTDHGYIPVFFAQADRYERLAASDINEGPLNKAKSSAAEYGVIDKIDFFLADGLLGCGDDYDTVIISGMGGDMIINILSAAPWTKSGVRIVLQPQTKLERLCGWLAENGYRSEEARLVLDEGKLYVVFSVSGGADEDLSPDVVDFIWRHLINSKDALFPVYLERLDKKYVRIIDGLKRAEIDQRPQLEETEKKLAVVREMMEEVSRW
ncbi:MAG: tRNA (adenine(22)-N(1))-methyltransferase [Oscillospiraceae bacterium]